VIVLRLVAFAGVIAAGLLGALPFRRTPLAPDFPLDTPRPVQLTLRYADSRLEASPAGDTSPAAGLLADSASPARPGVHEASYFVPTRPDLEQLSPPPDLAPDFRPARPAAAESGLWKPPRRNWPRKDQLPRQYTLRDGDTLQNLAERFLGSRARAPEIYAANIELLRSPDLLPIGKAIVIPPKVAGGDLEPAPAAETPAGD
jgi:hypothetical protein